MKHGTKRKKIEYLRLEYLVPHTSVFESMQSAWCGKKLAVHLLHRWTVQRTRKLGEESVDSGGLQASLVRMGLLHEAT